jgi:molybdopterin adenylyltransferase
MTISLGILTVSDRSFSGERADSSGPALARAAEQHGWRIARTAIIADERLKISSTLVDWCDGTENLDLILTTGGTGFSPRDITPEATFAVIERSAPGMAEAMRLASLKITPHAMLSRGIAGIRGATLIINLPGSPKAAQENFEVVAPVLTHAVELLKNNPNAEAGHRTTHA